MGLAGGGELRAYCCLGCEAVSRSILGLGLEDYYRLRERPAIRPASEVGSDLASFDDAAVQEHFATTLDGGLREARLLLEGLTCPACAWLVEQVAGRLPGVAAVNANYTARRAMVQWDPSSVKLSAILEAIRRVGYGAWPYEEGRVALIESNERRTALRRLWIAGLGMMQVMMYAVPAYFAGEGEITPDLASLMRWAGLVLTLPVIGYSAAPFFRGAWRDLRLRTLGMDVPVALGLGVAFIASAFATVLGRGEVYFDSVAMFVFLLMGGRYLEFVARGRAAESLRHLSRLSPAGMRKIAPGDVVLVRAGEGVPADGRLESDAALVSEAWLTGESRSLPKRRGERILGGSVNDGSAFSLRVQRVGADTAIASIQRMTDRALAERPHWVAAAQRASSMFVAGVLITSALAGLAWLAIDPSRALWIAVSVLIVTCPCAFALATPAAVTVAMGRLARGSFVVSRANAIEALASATDFVFDKTGTLTYGRPRLTAVMATGAMPEAKCRDLASAIARLSSHPLDRALACAGNADAIAVASHESVAGSGLQAKVDGRTLRLGRASYVAELSGKPVPPVWMDVQDSIVWLGDEEGCLACFRLGDELRPGTRSAIDALHAMGIVVHLLSGDEHPVAARIAAELGIPKVTARALPELKQRYVRNLQLGGACVAMVGDGINDAPVLAQADVSIAMGSGSDIASLRADAVLLSDCLADLVDGLRVATRTRRVVRQNIGWAIAYNGIAIPLAVAGWVTPLMAGIGMSASSLLVVLNALRLRG